MGATALGFYLKRKNLQPEKVFVSAAARTRETFSLINGTLELNTSAETRQDIYNADFDTLHEIISAMSENIGSLMLVGHNPGMHMLAMFFASATNDLVSFPPATLCVLNFDTPWADIQRHGGRVIALHKSTQEN